MGEGKGRQQRGGREEATDENKRGGGERGQRWASVAKATESVPECFRL